MKTIIKQAYFCAVFLALLTTPIFAAEMADSSVEKDFSMDGEFGLILTSGNTETTSLKSRLSSHHELSEWSNDYVLEAFYKQDNVMTEEGDENTITTSQRFFFSAQGNYKLENPENRLFAFASYEDSRFSNFDYQATLAVGWNSQLWKNDGSSFLYSIGPGYAFQALQGGQDASGVIVRSQLDYAWHISKQAQFKQIVSTEFGADNTKSRSETALSAKINGSFSMKVSLILNHNTDVEDRVKSLDTETAVTLVYSFF